jgi:hypothetical protein
MNETMSVEREADPAAQPIASIRNQRNPDQVVHIVYLRGESAFATSGISRWFAEREILIPAHLVVRDLELVGAILSAVLERLSLACESEGVFQYEPRFEVLETEYGLVPHGEYMRLDTV